MTPFHTCGLWTRQARARALGLLSLAALATMGASIGAEPAAPGAAPPLSPSWQLPPLPPLPEPTPGGQSGGDVRYRLAADSGSPLAGISAVQILIALSARDAEACDVAAAGLREAAAQPLRDAGLTVLEAQTGDARAPVGVPEVFVPVTVLRDESGVCAASLTVQLGVDADVVMLHRNVNAPPGTVVLSPGYVAIERSETLSVGVPPTFGTQVVAMIRELATQLAGKIVAARSAPRTP